MAVALDEWREAVDRGSPPSAWDVAGTGAWLVACRAEMDRSEAAWLEALARFDAQGGWSADGQLSCVEWLVWRTGMARATAHDKVRVARALRRRPILGEALASGEISYCAARAITRVDDPGEGVDEALVALARAGSVVDVERAVHHWQLCADQDRPPPDVDARRGLRITALDDGTARVEVVLTDLEAAELQATLDAFVQRAYRAEGDSSHEASDYSREDGRPHAARRADAFMDITHGALVHADESGLPGADRYLVHLVAAEGADTLETLDGAPLHPAAAATVACDASVVTHVVTAEGEPLALSRRTRIWSAAQRRAIAVRDAGRCRFPGCARRHVDVHHCVPWSEGGATDVANGLSLCPRHHHLLHAGWTTTGAPDHVLRFHRPDGVPIGATGPRPPTPHLPLNDTPAARVVRYRAREARSTSPRAMGRTNQ